MIKVQFEKDNENISLRLTGHAGADKKGKDIYCASASILAYTVAQTVRYMHENGNLREDPVIKLDEGDAYIMATPKPEDYGTALHTFFVAQVGYYLLASNYPQYVELKSFGKA